MYKITFKSFITCLLYYNILHMGSDQIPIYYNHLCRYPFHFLVLDIAELNKFFYLILVRNIHNNLELEYLSISLLFIEERQKS